MRAASRAAEMPNRLIPQRRLGIEQFLQRGIPQLPKRTTPRYLGEQRLLQKINTDGVLSYNEWSDIYSADPTDPRLSSLIAHVDEKGLDLVSPRDNQLAQRFVDKNVIAKILKPGLELTGGAEVVSRLGQGSSKVAFRTRIDDSEDQERVMLLGSEDVLRGEKAAYRRVEAEVALFNPEESTLAAHFARKDYSPAPPLLREGVLHLLSYNSEEGIFRSVLRIPFFDTVFRKGGILSEVISAKEDRLDFTFAGNILISMIRAREAIGRTHGDIKPDNTYVCSLPGRDVQCALIDLQENAYTPEYAAPEQFLTGAVRSSDLYAIGSIFYEMMTGKVPFIFDCSTEGVGDRLFALAREKTERGRLSLPGSPGDYHINDLELWKGIQTILGDMTEPDPAARFIIPGVFDIGQTLRMYRKVLAELVKKYLAQD